MNHGKPLFLHGERLRAEIFRDVCFYLFTSISGYLFCEGSVLSCGFACVLRWSAFMF